ncbi:MAG: hypothetical protein EHM61_09000 [Acidobacteria bacterium]|nr:MAG: hypothetical protein EHM61_09000 [Acidobacteriota bacterium]
MSKPVPRPPRPDRIRRIRGSFSWIDHRFLREGFDEGLDQLEKLLYFVLIAVSNRDGVSFYSDQRLSEILEVRFPHELAGARAQLTARDLIAFENGVYQVLALPARPLPPGRYCSGWETDTRGTAPAADRPERRGWQSLHDLLGRLGEPEDE